MLDRSNRKIVGVGDRVKYIWNAKWEQGTVKQLSQKAPNGKGIASILKDGDPEGSPLWRIASYDLEKIGGKVLRIRKRKSKRPQFEGLMKDALSGVLNVQTAKDLYRRIQSAISKGYKTSPSEQKMMLGLEQTINPPNPSVTA